MGRELTIWAGSVLWFAAAGGGLWLWDRYGSEPGRFAEVPDTGTRSDTGRWELTLYAHPHCPCVRGALAALGDLARDQPELTVRVAFVRPPGAPEGWERSSAWAVAALPGVRAFCDADGGAARRAGAETSGSAVLIDPSGRVAFRGGLTAAGGHGEAPGLRAVRAWLGTGTGPPRAPVFGCPLFDRD